MDGTPSDLHSHFGGTYALSMPPNDSSDENLMMEYAAGNAAAFETLYQRYRAPLYRYVLRNCSDPGISEELFQDIWIKLISAASRYQPTASFKTYLYHIAHNRMTDHYRHQGTRGTQTTLDIDSENTPQTAWLKAGEQPDQKLANQRGVSRLLALIDDLPDPQREAFLLREEGGLNLEQIAEITGVGRETVKSRLRYAIKSLREGLK